MGGQDLFPFARLVQEDQGEAGCLYLPLGDHQFLEIAPDSLTDRERYLIDLLAPKEERQPTNPWGDYLQGKGAQPQPLTTFQALQVHIWSESDSEGRTAWLDMMSNLLPNLQAVYSPNPSDYIFLLDQAPFFDVREILRDTLAAMEFDFGLRLTIFLGQMWPQKVESSWPQLFQGEQALFANWRSAHNQSRLLSFSQLYLWGGQAYPHLQKGLDQLLAHQQLEDVVLALWEAGAVLTKAAQSLYIHRNTLQYRLDKWQDWTGLQLKDLTDLAVCYQVILGQYF